jgi:frataxin-like iron-binding protein CyaY
MYYDDEYENIRVELDESDTPAARAYRLSNGDVFTIKGNNREYTLEFENNLLYEVVFKVDNESNQYSYNNGQWVQSKYERTRKVYTVDEINNLIMG